MATKQQFKIDSAEGTFTFRTLGNSEVEITYRAGEDVQFEGEAGAIIGREELVRLGQFLETADRD